MTKSTFGRGALAGLLGVSTLLASRVASSSPADEKKACVASYEQSQQLRNDGKLKAAKEQLLVCARDVCPASLRGDCATWLTEVDQNMPSVVVEAHDTAGKDTAAVKVSIDGKQITDKLDGKAIPVDPGPHSFHYELSGAPAVDEQLVIHQGEKNRAILVNFGGTKTPTPPTDTTPKAGGDDSGPSKGGAGVAPFVVGGLGIVAVGVGTVFYVTGKSSENKLRDSGCKPNCDSSSVDSVKHKYLIGDIAMGVGIVSLGIATYLLVSGSGSSAPAASSLAAPPRFDFVARPGGGFGALSGSFLAKTIALTMGDEPIPGGRLSRFARLASVGVRAGAAAISGNDGAKSAAIAADVLGTLRGLAAKVGQMASYVDGVVPEAQRDAYESAMKKLRANAPTTAFPEMKALIEAELGQPLSELFATFDEVPVASASIGQVFRATLTDGRAVAVKVQHPGIARAMESDLANAGVLEGMIGALGGARMNSRAMLDVVKARFREELDYAHEADMQRHFARVHRGDAQIVIPEVVDDRSTKRVLTTSFVEGLDFDQACALPDAERAAYCRTLWRYVFKGNLVGGKFNADPHPGNYVFQPDGRIAFLDFGCVQPIENHDVACLLHHAGLSRDEDEFGLASRRILNAPPGPYADLMTTFVRRCFVPIFESPFRVTRSYAGSLVAMAKETGLATRKLAAKDIVPPSPDLLFMNRLQFGFYSVLARLDSEVDYAGVERAFWPEVDGAPALPEPR